MSNRDHEFREDGIAIWFYLHQRGVSIGIGSTEGLLFIYLAAGLLFIFLLIEHIVSQFAHNITKPTKQESVSLKQFKGIVGFTLFEVFVWVVWLLLINFKQPIAAIVFFYAGLYFEHQFTNNVKNDCRFFHISGQGLIYKGLFIFTAFEIGGAAGWVNLVFSNPAGLVGYLTLVYLIPMIVGSFIEHFGFDKVGRIPSPCTG